MRKILVCCVVLLSLSSLSSYAHQVRPQAEIRVERTVKWRGVRARVALEQLPDDRVCVVVRTYRGFNRDTVSGHVIFPVLVNGHRMPFYAGRFGRSRLPMVIFAVVDPERVQDSRVIGYQISPTGMLIGQKVVTDESADHGHSQEMRSGRYQLVSINPEIGALYSVSYQNARFDGYMVTYEKMRVRQWDPAISAFIETDQGFLREHDGKLVETSRFRELNDHQKEQVFLANLEFARPMVRLRKQLRSTTAVR